MNPQSKISVVIPCYNEARVIEENVRQLRSALSTVTRNYQVVLSNDGSTDKTRAVIQRLSEEFEDVDFVSYDENQGAGYAFRQGLKAATGKYIFHMDADLAMNPAELSPQFLSALEDHHIVIASRYLGSRADYPLRRRIPSIMFAQLYRALFGLPIRDAMSGFFAFRKEIMDLIGPLEMKGFEIYLELFLKAHLQGLSIKEIPAKFVHQTDSGEVSVLTHGPKQVLNTLKVWKRFKLKSKVAEKQNLHR